MAEERDEKMTDERVTRGSGNVFADLGLPDPEERLAKAKLVQALGVAIEERGLTQIEAAELLGLHQPQVSLLLRGRTEGFSIERLIRLLDRMDRRVEITVLPKVA